MSEVKYISKFKILEILGEGAMGVVYRGFDKDLQRSVAIKTIHPHLLKESNRSEFLQRFQREAQSTSRCMHPNIVTIFEFGVSKEVMPYIVMEFIEGEELSAFSDRGIRFDLEESIDIMQQILSALSSAHHHHIIHRDIKPGNIFILEDGNVKIADFGIARIDSSKLTQTGMFIGTPNYMSPEQFTGEKVNACSDLFSAAVIFYELLTGENPFHGNSVTSMMHNIINHQPLKPSELNPDLPAAFDKILTRALAKDPAHRYTDAQSFAQAIREGNGMLASTDNNNDQQTRISPLRHKEKISQLNFQKKNHWPEHILDKIITDLTPFIGPMANILVHKQSKKYDDMNELCKSLSESIPRQDEALTFILTSKKYSFPHLKINNLAAMDEPHSHYGAQHTGIHKKDSGISSADKSFPGNSRHFSQKSNIGDSTALPVDELTQEQLMIVEEKLLEFIGPMATVLIQRTMKKTQFTSELYQALAEYIPSEKEKEKFLSELKA